MDFIKMYMNSMRMHLDASLALLSTGFGSMPRFTMAVYHAGYVTECGLKALYLTKHSVARHERIVNEEFKKKSRHDLQLTVGLLKKVGVHLPVSQKRNVLSVRARWTSEMRYEPIATDHADALDVVRAAQRFANWLEEFR
jgi:hypothetical protein